MKITRLYTGPDGESHFEEIDLPPGLLHKTEGIYLKESAPGTMQDWHPAPCRQYVITLSGESEIETASGVRRRFGPGAVMLADDTTGRGHITRIVGDQVRVCAMIPVAP
jgi:hypothetical protein